MSKIRITLDGINNRLYIAEKKTGIFEGMTVKATQMTHRNKNDLKNPLSIRLLWNSFKWPIISVNRFPGVE